MVERVSPRVTSMATEVACGLVQTEQGRPRRGINVNYHNIAESGTPGGHAARPEPRQSPPCAIFPAFFAVKARAGTSEFPFV